MLARDGDVFGKPTGDTLRFEEIAGLVEVEILKEGAGIVGARLTSPEPFKRGDDVASARVAEACGIDATDLAIVNHSPCVATAGLPFVFAEVNSAGALSVASPVTDAFARHFPAADVAGICLYACVPKDQADVQARVFAPLHGVPEDPATGSANVALVGLRASVAAGDDLEFDHVVAQGADMGRPSLLYAGAEKANGVVTATRVGGRCVPVMKGALSLS